MIGYLKGDISEIHHDKVTMDIQGIGYIVFLNEKDKAELPTIGSQAKILIHSITKEDGTVLYGFLSETTRSAFIELIKISGVSGRTANAILSHCSAQALQVAVLSKEEGVLTAVPGIGKKLANRIINECKAEHIAQEDELVGTKGAMPSINKTKATTHIEAVSGLVNIGIKQELAKEAVVVAMQLNQDATVEEIIKVAIARIYEKQK